MRICTLEGCSSKHYARRLCQRHYDQRKGNQDSAEGLPELPARVAFVLDDLAMDRLELYAKRKGRTPSETVAEILSRFLVGVSRTTAEQELDIKAFVYRQQEEAIYG